MLAFVEDGAGSHIGKVWLAAPFAVVHNAAADAAFLSNCQDHAAAGRTGPFVDIEMKSGPSSLLRCTVPMVDDSRMWAAPSSLVTYLPYSACRRIEVRSYLADALIRGEADSGRPAVREKDVVPFGSSQSSEQLYRTRCRYRLVAGRPLLVRRRKL